MEFIKIKSSDSTPSSTFDLRRELWLLTYASSSCRLVCELCNFALSGFCQEGDSIYTGIINAIYVAYGRPFHWCMGIGRLNEKDLPAEATALHNEIIHLRDKLYAHKDLNGYQVECERFSTVRAVVIGGRITLVSNELIPRGLKLQTIMEHVKRLVEHFDSRAITLLRAIRRPGWPADGEYILNMEAMSDDIFKPVPISDATALVKRMTEHLTSSDTMAGE